MEVLYILVPMSLLLAGGGLAACIWALRSGQYDDVDGPAQLLIHEDLQKEKAGGAQNQP